MMPRIILDTNVFISGIFWEGNYCSQIIAAWKAGRFTLVTSLEIVKELVDTLREFKIEMPAEIIEGWRTMIVENSTIVLPLQKLDLVKDDPKDNKFFEAALAGEAQYLVSQDKKQVLKIQEFRGIRTVTPEKFCTILAGWNEGK